MTQVTVDEPHSVERKTVDGSGRVYLGRDLSGQDVEIVVSIKSDGDDDQDDSNAEPVEA